MTSCRPGNIRPNQTDGHAKPPKTEKDHNPDRKKTTAGSLLTLHRPAHPHTTLLPPRPPPPAPPGPQTQPAVAKRNLEEYGKCSIRFCPPLAHSARRNLSFYTRTLIFPGKDELTPCDRRLANSRSHGDATFLLVNKAVDKIDVLERTHRTRAVLTSENSSCSHTRAVAGLRMRRSAWKRVGL